MKKEKNDLCPNKKVCGSCSWSHIPYAEQLKQKLADINGSFAKNNLPAYCKEITPSPITKHYRNRMDFTINYKGLVGLREKGKWWSIIDDHHCFISDQIIEKHFMQVRKWTKSAELTFFDRKAHTGLLRYAVIRASSTGDSLLNIITSKPESAHEEAKITEQLHQLAKIAQPTSLVWGISHTVSDVSRGDENIAIYKDPWIHDLIGDYRYQINPTDFFQTNSQGAELLLKSVTDKIAQTKSVFENTLNTSGNDFKCIDLYCGSGFFTIPLADFVSNPVGVELIPEAIKTAEINAQLNNKEITFHASKTEDFSWSDLKPDAIIVDPPRAGLHDNVVSEIKKNPPKHIIYVSCNYKALARELQILQDTYEVITMEAIDMFPHTPHVEVVSLLQSKK